MSEQDLLIDTIAALTKELFKRYPETGGACLIDGDKITEIQRQAFMDGAMWFGQYAKDKSEEAQKIQIKPDIEEKISKWQQRVKDMMNKGKDINGTNEG